MSPLWYWTPAYSSAAAVLVLAAIVAVIVRAEVIHRRRMRGRD